MINFRLLTQVQINQTMLCSCLLPWPHQSSTEMTALILTLSSCVSGWHMGSVYAQYRCSFVMLNLWYSWHLGQCCTASKRIPIWCWVQNWCSTRLPHAHIFTQLPTHPEEFNFKWKSLAVSQSEQPEMHCIKTCFRSQPQQYHDYTNLIHCEGFN